MYVQLTLSQVAIRHKEIFMHRPLIEYVLLALLMICVIGLGANALSAHADKFKAPFRTINRALSQGSRQ